MAGIGDKLHGVVAKNDQTVVSSRTPSRVKPPLATSEDERRSTFKRVSRESNATTSVTDFNDLPMASGSLKEISTAIVGKDLTLASPKNKGNLSVESTKFPDTCSISKPETSTQVKITACSNQIRETIRHS